MVGNKQATLMLTHSFAETGHGTLPQLLTRHTCPPLLRRLSVPDMHQALLTVAVELAWVACGHVSLPSDFSV